MGCKKIDCGAGNALGTFYSNVQLAKDHYERLCIVWFNLAAHRVEKGRALFRLNPLSGVAEDGPVVACLPAYLPTCLPA